MTIQDLGSIGELVAAIATVATLGYLAVQIRSATRAMLLESHRSAHSLDNTLTVIADNGELAEIFNRGLADVEALDPVEFTRFTMIVSELINKSQLLYAECQLLRDTTYLQTAADSVRFLRAPGGRVWWAKNLRSWRPDYVEWISKELEL